MPVYQHRGGHVTSPIQISEHMRAAGLHSENFYSQGREIIIKNKGATFNNDHLCAHVYCYVDWKRCHISSMTSPGTGRHNEDHKLIPH